MISYDLYIKKNVMIMFILNKLFLALAANSLSRICHIRDGLKNTEMGFKKLTVVLVKQYTEIGKNILWC